MERLAPARHGTARSGALPALLCTLRPAALRPGGQPPPTAPPRHGTARLGTYPPPRAPARHGSPPARPDCCCEVQGPQGTGSKHRVSPRRAVLRAPGLCGRGARNTGCKPIPARRLRVHTSGWFGDIRGGRLCSSVAAGGLRWAGNIHPICLQCTCPTCCYLRHSEERNCIEQATFSRLLMQHNSGIGPVSAWGPAKAMLGAGRCLPARNEQLTSPFSASAQPSSGKAATPPKADAVFTGQGFLQTSEGVICSRERQLQLGMFIEQQKLVRLLSL